MSNRRPPPPTDADDQQLDANINDVDLYVEHLYEGLPEKVKGLKNMFEKRTSGFLVADTQFYKRLCLSVCLSVR